MLRNHRLLECSRLFWQNVTDSFLYSCIVPTVLSLCSYLGTPCCLLLETGSWMMNTWSVLAWLFWCCYDPVGITHSIMVQSCWSLGGFAGWVMWPQGDVARFCSRAGLLLGERCDPTSQGALSGTSPARWLWLELGRKMGSCGLQIFSWFTLPRGLLWLR